MAVNAPAAANSGSRRVMVGFNVVLGSVLACVVFGLALWAAGRFGGRIDVTSDRVNSLSDGTTKLLRKLAGTVRLTAAYTTANKEAFKFREKHKKFVADLLDLYETAGRGKVSTAVIDPQMSPAAMEKLLERLRGKSAYADEAKPHREALESLPKLTGALSTFGLAESGELERLIKADEKLGKVKEIALIERTLGTLDQQLRRALQESDDQVKSETPHYAQALQVARDILSNTRELLQKSQEWLSGSGAGLSGISEETRSLFATASQRFAPPIAQIDEFLKKTEKLQPVKLEALLDSLKRGQCVVVETDTEAQVLTEDNDVWPYKNSRDAAPSADGDTQEFAGEEAISSAILHLTQKDKTAVILTRFGGSSLLMPDFSRITNPAQLQNMPPAPFEALNQRLTKDNFQAVEWDVKADAKPPATPDAKRFVYVVFPPEPPPQSNPMQPSRQPGISPEQKQAVLNAVGESGMAMFLVGWTPSQMPGMAPPYEYNEYLKKEWGIEARTSHIAVEFTLNPQRKGVFVPANQPWYVLASETAFRFTDQPIAAPISGLPTGFDYAAPLQLAKGADAPAGVTLSPIAEVPATENVWAFDNVMRIQQDMQKKMGTTKADTDIGAPFVVAVAGEKKVGDQTNRIVVIGSEHFAGNQMAEAAAPAMLGSQLMMIPLYPGNLNLFENSLHWLTGNADRIAVAPSRGDVPRLKMTDGQSMFARIFVVGIWPGLALVAGAIVWMLRR